MYFRKRLRRFKWQPSGTIGVRALGHRRFVGGHWEEMGHLQFDFMIKQGLKPNHVLLDIACGALRGGRYFIPFLETGNYLGIEKEGELLRIAKMKELDPALLAAKQPELIVDGNFNFGVFSRRPDFAIANSLFSHLNLIDISACLQNLYSVAQPECVFFATFRPSDGEPNPRRSTAHADFRFTVNELDHASNESGWSLDYIGEWGHPTGQHMVALRRH